MGSVLSSIDNMLSQDAARGIWRRAVAMALASNVTAANSTSGYISTARLNATLTIPTFGGSVTAAYVVAAGITGNTSAPSMLALEVPLGTLTVSGNSFAAGSSMPTRTIEGSSMVTASMIPIVVATTALGGATTPALTITYTNQAGTGSQTCSMTLPTNPVVNTGFVMTPHLANGDTGVRAVSNMSISTGSSGVLKVYGLIPICWGPTSTAGGNNAVPPLIAPFPVFPLLAGDIISAYRFAAAVSDCYFYVAAIGDN